MVYSSALEMRRAARHREFESHLLRNIKNDWTWPSHFLYLSEGISEIRRPERTKRSVVCEAGARRGREYLVFYERSMVKYFSNS